MRAIAVRRSVTVFPLRFIDAEFAIRSRRAASAGSEPTTRTTCSAVGFGSERIRRICRAISGNDGKSTWPWDSSSARLRMKSNATLDGDCTGLISRPVWVILEAPPRLYFFDVEGRLAKRCWISPLRERSVKRPALYRATTWRQNATEPG